MAYNENPSYAKLSNGAIIGQLQYFANAGGDSAYTAQGWLKCSGQVLTQATYTALYASVGLLNPPGQFWLNQNSTTTTTMSAIIYGNGVYAIAGGNTILSSTDLKTWTKRPAPCVGNFLAGTFGANTFMFTGSSSNIVTSTDATSWSSKLPNVTNSGANAGNFLLWTTKFVAPVAGGVFVTSTDANLFTAYQSPMTTNVFSLAFGNSLYVAGGQLGQVLTSTDAQTWTARTASTTSSVQALVYGTQWVAAGQGGMIKTSTDAITWTAQTSGTSSNLYSLTYGNSLYLFGGVGGVLATSTDAVTWTSRTSATTSTISTITFGTVYAYGGGGGRIASSTDAITWTNRTSNTTSSILSMIWSGALYVYATQGGGIGTSTDATTWTSRTIGTSSDIVGLAWDGALYHAIGNQVNLTSTDAITWTLATQYPTSQSLSAATFANSLFVVGGTGGVLASSTDGFTWTSRTSGSTAPINGLGYGAGVYVLAANGGYLASSTDAITWTSRTSFSTQTLSTVTFGTLFVVGGAQGLLITSTDGTTWTEEPILNVSQGVLASAYNSGVYVVAGGGGTIYTSTDANTWVSRTSNTSSSIQSMVSAGGFFAGTGVGGIVLNSYNAYPYDTSTQFQLPTDAGLGITLEPTSNFNRSLYIKAA